VKWIFELASDRKSHIAETRYFKIMRKGANFMRLKFRRDWTPLLNGGNYGEEVKSSGLLASLAVNIFGYTEWECPS